MYKLLPASLALALAGPMAALADTPPDASSDIRALRREITAMQADYEARMRALEMRLQAAEAAAAPPAPTPVTAAAAPLPPSPPSPPPSPPPPPAPAAAANAFNPAISLILSGLYTGTSQDPAKRTLTGFQLPPDAELSPGSRGLSLAESELGFAASIDPWWRGQAAIALASDNTASVEEAYVQTTALGNGLSLKAGRFFSDIGYLNPQHAHTWDFVDNPLAYQAFLGTQYGDDGLQLTWLAPIDQYLALGLEVGRGRGYPGSDTSRNGAGMVAITAHTGGDLGDSHSWRLGLSVQGTKAQDQALIASDAAGSTVTNAFSGNTRVWVADAVWKWAPDGNATRTSFKLQGEYLRSVRSGNLVYDLGGADSMGAYAATQSGWYLQGVYQFMPRWRIGLRTERLDPGNPDYGVNAAAFVNTAYRPAKNTLMFDFSSSEFSRLRLQLAQDRSREGVTDRQVFLQYQMSLGAHGAHGY